MRTWFSTVRATDDGVSSRAGSARQASSARIGVATLVTLLSATACADMHGPPGRDPFADIHDGLVSDLRRIAEQAAPATVAIAFRDLGSGERVSIGGAQIFHAASLMKVFVMIEVMRQSESGGLDLDRAIPVKTTFKSIVDGSPFSVARDDDSDPDLHDAEGSLVTIRELVARMITQSSNLATNLLIEQVGAPAVDRGAREIGATQSKILRGVEDVKAFRAGIVNTTTADDMAEALDAIATRRAAPAALCAEMVRILLAQEFNDQIPAGLPDGVRVAHKTGQITAIHHDAAIVYPDAEPPFVLVVMTQGFEDEKASAKVAADVARTIFAARRTLDPPSR